jgi:hypothetical protein
VAALVAVGAAIAAVLVSPGALLHETFTSAGALGRWQVVAGLVRGDGPASAVDWDAGAARLSADRTTRVFRALARDVPVAGARWGRLSGRMRTEGVDPSGARHADCNLFLRHANGIAGTAPLAGTRGWTEVRRRIALPPGTERVTVGLFLAVPGRAWFDDVRLERADAPAWSEEIEGHYRYRVLPGDAVPPEARRANEASYRRVGEFLGVTSPPMVTYVKYPDVATKEELFGIGGNAHRVRDTIHTVWPLDAHEIVHVLADAWGDPPALVAEGLAVHLSGAWQGKPVRAYARGLLDGGGWIAPSTLLASAAFRAAPDLASYAVAGALIEWVLATRGKRALRGLYRMLENGAALDVNRRRFAEALGVAVEQADTELREWVGRAD